MSIDVNVQNDLVIVTESSEDITVNVSNAPGADGVGVPTGGTTGQVLKKFSNTNYDTYWAADASGLTSVGLSMPSAFAVSNSPLTSNGTIAVTGAGTASQYVRGDGQLANFPDNGGGGSSVNYYLNGSITQGTFGGTTYYEMSKTPVLGAGTNFTRTNGQGNGYIASFITDAGDPSLLNIPGGNWNVEFYFQSSASGGSPQFYGELYKVSSADVFTLVASGSTNPEGITNGTTVDEYYTSIPVPQTSLLVTDRLAIRIYVIPAGRTITLHTENGNLCEVLTTFSTGLNALNGLTAQVQYFATGTSGTDFAISSATDTHTFNLPTASATNRGALSSADWSTFSGKVGGSGATGQVAYWNGTSSQTGSNNLFWDAANARLGIGIALPTSKLHIIGVGTTSATTPLRISDSAGTLLMQLNDIGHLTLASNQQSKQARIYMTGYNTYPALTISSSSTILSSVDNSDLYFYGNTIRFYNGTGGTEWARFFNTSNLVLQNGGTFTDSGQRLQVMGDAFIKGSGATSATSALLVQNTNGTLLLNVQNSGTTIARSITNNDATVIFAAQQQNGNTRFSVNALGQTFIGGDANAATDTLLRIERNFNPTSGTATHTTTLLIPTINQTGGANGITRGLYVNPTLTAAADWRSIEWSNNSGWGLFGAGTCQNYLNGSLGIGSTENLYKLDVFGNARFLRSQNNATTLRVENATAGTAAQADIRAYNDQGDFFSVGIYSSTTTTYGPISSRSAFNYTAAPNGIAFMADNATGNMRFATGGNSERMRLTAAGRLLLGTTTESTFLLDVNGTARVSDNLIVSKNQSLTTNITISNTNSGSSVQSALYLANNLSSLAGAFIKNSSTTTAYKILGSGDLCIYNDSVANNGDISILNDRPAGIIKFSAGGSSTAQLQIETTGKVSYAAATTAKAQINLASGTAPTSPVNGDIWFDGTDLKIRVGGVTKTFTLL